MPDYSLGTAKGTIEIGYDGSGITRANQGLDDFSSRAKKIQGDFSDVARVTGLAAGALAAGIGLAVNSAIDFEKQISAIGAVSGASADEMDLLRKKALQLGADTAFSASDAALAMEELVKAGLSVEEVLNGAADATVNLAAAGGVDLAEAATIASNAMNQFGLAAEDMPHIADLIAGAANASAIDVGQFGFSLSQAGAVANLVGVNFEDLATAIALMGNQGIVGSDAGTSLKTMLQNLQPTTEKQIELMRELGIVTEDGANQFFTQEGSLKSLAEVAGVLNGALAGMTDAQKTMALETLFGSDAIRAAAVFAGQGAEGFSEMAAAMGEVSAQDVAEQRLDNVAGSIEQLKGSLETAAIQLGTALLPAIKLLTDFITGLINKFSSLDPKWQQLIAFGAVAAAALLAVVSAIAALGAIIAGVAAASGAGVIVAVILGVIAAVAALAAGIKVLWDNSEAFRVLVFALWKGIQTAFGGILDALRPLGEWFRDTFIPAVRDTAKEFIDRLQPAFEAIQMFVNAKLIPMWAKIQEAIEKAMPTLIEIGNFLLTTGKAAWETLGSVLGFVIPIIAKVAGVLIDILGPVIAFLIGLIPVLWEVLKFGVGIIAGLIQAVIAVGQWFGDVFSAIGTAVKTAIDFIGGILGAIWGVIGAPVEAALGLLKAIFEAAWAFISAIVAIFMLGLKETFAKLDEWIVQPVRAAWDFIQDRIDQSMEYIRGIVDEKWQQIKAIWDTVYGFIVPPIQAAWDFIRNFIDSKMGGVKDDVDSKWNLIKGIWEAAVNFVVGIADRIKEFVDKVRNFFNELKAAAEGGTDSLMEFVGQIPGRIIGALGDLAGLLYGKGRDIIQGLINGISSMIGRVGDAMGGIMDKIGDFLPGSPAKEGPLSGRGYALYRGEHLTEDLATGIANGAVDAERAVRAVVGNISQEIPTELSVRQQFNAAPVPVPTQPAGDTIININVDLEDLKSIEDVQELLEWIDNLRNRSRKGTVTV